VYINEKSNAHSGAALIFSKQGVFIFFWRIGSNLWIKIVKKLPRSNPRKQFYKIFRKSKRIRKGWRFKRKNENPRPPGDNFKRIGVAVKNLTEPFKEKLGAHTRRYSLKIY
jgi:hypothetical protein